MRGSSARRLLLACAFVAWANPMRHAVSRPQVNAELNHYGGTASGAFTGGSCLAAPAARVYYQGVAGRVAVRPAQRDTREWMDLRVGPRAPVGGVLELSGAVQVERYSLLEAGETQYVDDVPKRRLRSAVAASVGYDWPMVGFKGGLLLRQAQGEVLVESCMDRPGHCPSYGGLPFRGFPDLALRLGPFEPVHLDLGLGAYNLPTLLQPGWYAGLTAQYRGYRVSVYTGEHATFHDRFGRRFDAACAIPATDTLRVIGGVGVTEGHRGANEFEGRVGLEWIVPGKRW